MSELDDFVAEESEVDTTVEMTADSHVEEAPSAETTTEAAADEVAASDATDTSSEETGVTAEPPAAEPQTESQSEPVMVPLAAKQAEKERRIQAERELEAIRQAQAEQPTPDAFVEPDKAIQHAVNQVRAEMQAQRNAMSEAQARKNHDDFDQKIELFGQLAQQNPYLIQQMQSEFDPGEFVYQTAKQHMDLQEVGNLDSYKENLRAELKAEIMAELEAQKPAPATPPNLSTVRTSGGDPVDDIPDGNDGLEQLLQR